MLQWHAGEGGEMQTWDGQVEDKDVMKALLKYRICSNGSRLRIDAGPV